ncbi:Uu.00g144260.m01.CDS01 [Anthostomella pinea]|uniref:Uu.00g144260.m01.CDS01 n=1 Tax=Anthostomella pinea TaxID=933095 RepID=A0AAI8VKB3_9PEZI|nr:Uu.00g144260.m01.CDS01 [Anthostomella pinea]
MKPETLIWLPADQYSSVHGIWDVQFVWCPLAVDKNLPLHQTTFITIGGKEHGKSRARVKAIRMGSDVDMLDQQQPQYMAADMNSTNDGWSSQNCAMRPKLGDGMRTQSQLPYRQFERQILFPALSWSTRRRRKTADAVPRTVSDHAVQQAERKILFPALGWTVWRRNSNISKKARKPRKGRTSPRGDPELPEKPPAESPQPPSHRSAARTPTERGRTASEKVTPTRKVSPSTERALEQAQQRREAIEKLRAARRHSDQLREARWPRPPNTNGLHSFHLLSPTRSAPMESIPHSPLAPPSPTAASLPADCSEAKMVELPDVPDSAVHPESSASTENARRSGHAQDSGSVHSERSVEQSDLVSDGETDDRIDRWRSQIPSVSSEHDSQRRRSGRKSRSPRPSWAVTAESELAGFGPE